MHKSTHCSILGIVRLNICRSREYKMVPHCVLALHFHDYLHGMWIFNPEISLNYVAKRLH